MKKKAEQAEIKPNHIENLRHLEEMEVENERERNVRQRRLVKSRRFK